VDTDFYDNRDLNRDWTKPVFGRLSRPDPGKWSSLALDVLPLVKARIPDFKCRMIGAIPEAFEFVRAKNLEQNVEFCEPVCGESELAGFLGGVNVLAHANDAGESFGLVIAEAMAAGLPVVTHPAAGNRDNAQLELVEHGVTGLVAENADDYAAALARLLSRPDEAEAMGRAGRDKAKRLFRVQNLVTKLESIYARLLSDTSNAAHGHTNARASIQRLHQGSPAL
jgi:glycosyltransferase involved in cell wall biosynthesis